MANYDDCLGHPCGATLDKNGEIVPATKGGFLVVCGKCMATTSRLERDAALATAKANADEAARMRKALEFYADPASWANVTQWDQRKIEVGGFTLDAVVIHSPAMDDDGKTARAALRIDSALAEGGKP